MQVVLVVLAFFATAEAAPKVDNLELHFHLLQDDNQTLSSPKDGKDYFVNPQPRGGRFCQLVNTIYVGMREPETLRDVTSWNHCGLKCLEHIDCKFWTWTQERWTGIDGHTCIIMKGYTSTSTDSKRVSGPRGCPSVICPTTTGDGNCVFPYKSGSDTFTTCGSFGGLSYGWCATRVSASTGQVLSTARCDPGQCSAGPDACHSININTNLRTGVETIDDVTSWNDCGVWCGTKSNCQAWTWYYDTSESGNNRKKCILMSGYASTSIDGNTVSGLRACPAGSDRTYNGPTDKVWSNVQCRNLGHVGNYGATPDKCKYFCTKNPSCNAVKYAPTGDTTADCVLMGCPTPIPNPTLTVEDYYGLYVGAVRQPSNQGTVIPRARVG